MGKMIFVVGPAGAGKTTIAEALSAGGRAAYLDMDSTLRPAAEAIMKAAGLDPEDRDSPEYKALCRDLGYRMTMNAALDNARLGTDICVVGPFTKETDDPGWLGRELSALGSAATDVAVKVVCVYLDDERRYRERIEARDLRSDDWKLRHWEAFKRTLAPRRVAWPLPDGAVVYWDNSAPFTESRLAELRQLLDR